MADDEGSQGNDEQGGQGNEQAGEYYPGGDDEGPVQGEQDLGGDQGNDDQGNDDGVGAIDETIGQGYQAILDVLDSMADQVGRYAQVRDTIVSAALIEANAALIAAAGAQARDKVLEITGSKPSSGFVGETADGIASRAQVLPAVWGDVVAQNGELAFFLGAFGNDPCIAARLNGVQEYAAQMAGIPANALADPVNYNQALIGEIQTAHSDYEETNPPNAYDENAFRAWLGQNRPDLVGDQDFADSWGMAKMVLMLT